MKKIKFFNKNIKYIKIFSSLLKYIINKINKEIFKRKKIIPYNIIKGNYIFNGFINFTFYLKKYKYIEKNNIFFF